MFQYGAPHLQTQEDLIQKTFPSMTDSERYCSWSSVENGALEEYNIQAQAVGSFITLQ